MLKMMQRILILTAPLALIFLLCPGNAAAAAHPLSVTTYTGTFSDGATYIIQVPSNWNGTLVLYSHGYTGAGSANPAYDVGDALTGDYLLSNGYALGGSSYATTGWAVQQALPDQIEVLDTFNTLVRKPKRTIAWGHSMGGIITAGLVQRYPTRFDGALPMCGVVAGAVGFWNQLLNSGVAFNVLFGSGSGLQVVNITDPAANLAIVDTLIASAQSTLQGQARLALVAALADVPGWVDPSSPPPPPYDYTDQEDNQYAWLSGADLPFTFYYRAELEGRAAGNPSWDTNVDFAQQLALSVDYNEVQALYQQAGLDLNADLQALNSADPINANPASLDYLSQNIIFNGKIHVPVLTLHTKGDGLVFNEDENAYLVAVANAGNAKYLREIFVDRAGHCAFTSGETIAAFEALIKRLDSGEWDGLSSAQLNNAANALGSGYNAYPVAFFDFEPTPFLRPYDAVNH